MDSPRSSKRRRTSPLPQTSSPSTCAKRTPAPRTQTPGSLRRPTRRGSKLLSLSQVLPANGVGPTIDDGEENAPSNSRGSLRSRSSRGEILKDSAEHNEKGKDVYDDIEGALDVDQGRTKATPGRTSNGTKSPEKRTVGRTTYRERFEKMKQILESGLRMALTKQTKEHEGEELVDEDEEDELVQAVTPSKRRRNSQEEEPEADEMITSSKKGRKGAEVDDVDGFVHEDREDPRVDEEDELAPNTTSSRSTRGNTRTQMLLEAEKEPVASPVRSTRKRNSRTKIIPEEPTVSDEEDPPVNGVIVGDSDMNLPQTAGFMSIRDKSKASSKVNGFHTGPEYTVDNVSAPSASETSFHLLQRLVLEKITGKRSIPLTGLEDEYTKVYQLLEQTVVSGEGNSMLLIGGRGSGKSSLVRKSIAELSKAQKENFHVINLNGFIHTDDKLALREIWRQLGREMEIEDDSLSKNYADTLATLLALLSHPSEIAGEESDKVAKAVLFIMDEFDLFASHPRQTLLYNLFDIAQSRKAPVAVLGLTTRIDVTESLEKRVKSRFSHRYIHISLPKSFSAFKEIFKAALQVRPEELNVEERALLSTPLERQEKRKKASKEPISLLASWNSSIDSLLSNLDFQQSHLHPIYATTKSIPALLSSLYLPVAALTPTSPLLNPTTVDSVPALVAPQSNLSLLSLSDLALALLIAAARLDIILDTDTCNFLLAYNEYVALASKARIQSAASGALAGGTRVWGKDVARREWETLVSLGLLMPVIGTGGGAIIGERAMVRCDVALEEIGEACRGMDRVMTKWCRQI